MCRAPIVLAHVAEGGADAALRCDRVAARGKYLLVMQAVAKAFCFGETERLREGSASAGAYDDDVVGVIDESVGRHLFTEGDLEYGEHAARGAAIWCAKLASSRLVNFVAGPCT